MNTKKIGKYITQKRKDPHMTQEDLAKQLDITNKTVRKYTAGVHSMEREKKKCLPDFFCLRIYARFCTSL